jgi:hypothetical protein
LWSANATDAPDIIYRVPNDPKGWVRTLLTPPKEGSPGSPGFPIPLDHPITVWLRLIGFNPFKVIRLDETNWESFWKGFNETTHIAIPATAPIVGDDINAPTQDKFTQYSYFAPTSRWLHSMVTEKDLRARDSILVKDVRKGRLAQMWNKKEVTGKPIWVYLAEAKAPKAKRS